MEQGENKEVWKTVYLGECCKADYKDLRIGDKVLSSKKIGLLLLFISINIKLLTLPTSPGNFYEPAHYYNLYLPNFGFHQDIAILPSALKTFLGMYISNKVMIEILNGNVLLLHQFFYVIQPIFVFLSFYLFFTMINAKKYSFLLSGLLSIIFNWPSTVLLLGMTCMFCIVHEKRPFTIILILSFLTLTLYWHSGHMLFFTAILFFVGFILVIKTLKRQNTLIEMTRITVLLIISLFVWVWVRGLYGVHNISDFWKYFQFEYLYRGLFSKGSFVPPEYLYKSKFATLGSIVDILRYTTYAVVVFLTFFFSLNSLKRLKFDSFEFAGLPLLISTGSFIFLYYMATYTIGPAAINVFIIPYFLALIGNKIDLRKSNRKLYIVLFIFITCSLSVSYIYQEYVDLNTNPQFNQNFDIFATPSFWIVEHGNNHHIISDADTLGYLAIWYGRCKLYLNYKIYYLSIDNYFYDKLYTGRYNSAYYVVYNYELYDKNLVFESLQAWNKYKPLDPTIVLKNGLSIIYSSEKIWILKNFNRTLGG